MARVLAKKRISALARITQFEYRLQPLQNDLFDCREGSLTFRIGNLAKFNRWSMEARCVRGMYCLVALLCLGFNAGASYKTPNFVVSAATPELAEKIGRLAERYRHTLAIAWTGKPMPDWSQPCPIKAIVNPKLGAGGETSFVFDRNEVYGWKMEIRGTEERVLDSVLPHEITHTIFASYFRRPLPRWADEGACTTMEHESERGKHYRLLQHFLRNNRGIPFSDMFVMKQYPQDILPLYAQGYSLARFLIQQGGRQQFMEFLAAGMERDEWAKVVKQHYGYQSLAELQGKWLAWVEKGCPDLPTATADAREGAPTELQAWPDRRELAQTPIVRGQSIDNTASSRTPVSNGDPFLQTAAATTVVQPRISTSCPPRQMLLCRNSQ